MVSALDKRSSSKGHALPFSYSFPISFEDKSANDVDERILALTLCRYDAVVECFVLLRDQVARLRPHHLVKQLCQSTLAG